MNSTRRRNYGDSGNFRRGSGEGQSGRRGVGSLRLCQPANFNKAAGFGDKNAGHRQRLLSQKLANLTVIFIVVVVMGVLTLPVLVACRITLMVMAAITCRLRFVRGLNGGCVVVMPMFPGMYRRHYTRRDVRGQ